jgi:hypothetical protein
VPNGSLQAISTSTSIVSPPAASSTSVASGRGCTPDELMPCTTRPPIQTVHSLRVSSSRSTRAPAHLSGTVAATRSQ